MSERFFFLNFETHLQENMAKTRIYMKLPNQHCGAVGEPITQRSANQTFCCTKKKKKKKKKKKTFCCTLLSL